MNSRYASLDDDSIFDLLILAVGAVTLCIAAASILFGAIVYHFVPDEALAILAALAAFVAFAWLVVWVSGLGDNAPSVFFTIESRVNAWLDSRANDTEPVTFAAFEPDDYQPVTDEELVELKDKAPAAHKVLFEKSKTLDEASFDRAARIMIDRILAGDA